MLRQIADQAERFAVYDIRCQRMLHNLFPLADMMDRIPLVSTIVVHAVDVVDLAQVRLVDQADLGAVTRSRPRRFCAPWSVRARCKPWICACWASTTGR